MSYFTSYMFLSIWSQPHQSTSW